VGRYAKEPTGGDFEKTPPGTHIGVCFRVIDLGTQHEEYQGEPRVANRVLVSWELPNELMQDGRPFAVSRFYTNSLHEKSALRKDLEAWRGKPFTKAELERFDLASILNKAAMISVVHTETGREKVNSVIAIPKGTPTPSVSNDLTAFFIDEWDDAVFATIPKGIQEIIKKSDEFKLRQRDGDAPFPSEEGETYTITARDVKTLKLS